MLLNLFINICFLCLISLHYLCFCYLQNILFLHAWLINCSYLLILSFARFYYLLFSIIAGYIVLYNLLFLEIHMKVMNNLILI